MTRTRCQAAPARAVCSRGTAQATRTVPVPWKNEKEGEPSRGTTYMLQTVSVTPVPGAYVLHQGPKITCGNPTRSQTDHANHRSNQNNQEHPVRRAGALSHTSSNSRRQFADVFPSQRSSQTKKVHDSCPETRGRVEGCTLPTPRASTPTHSHMPTCPRIES